MSTRSAGRSRQKFSLVAAASAAVALSLASPAVAQVHTWITRVSPSNFSDPNSWLNGDVPSSGSSTELYFTNLGHASYRAFNDLGILTLGGITLETRTGTATFIAQASGSAFQFGDGSFIRSTDIGLFRFGGITGVPNDWRLTGNLTLDTQSYGNTYVAAPVSGAGSITVTGSGPSEIDGFFRLEGANTFAGGVTLQSGLLEIGNASGLGTGVLTAAGGRFRTTGSMTVSNDVSATSDLLLRPTGGFTLAGVISGPGGVDLRSVGAINSTVTLTNANTYAGETVIDMPEAFGVPSGVIGIKAGGITLSGGGTATSSSSFDIRNGGVLELNWTSNPGLSRIGDTAPVNLVNGRINAVGNNTAGNNTVERVGPINVEGMATFFMNGRTGGIDLSTPSLTRANRGTLQLTQGNDLSLLSVDAAPSMIGGVVPWAAGTSGILITSPRELVTYENGRFRSFTAGEYASDLAAGPTANVKLPAGTSGSPLVIENNDTVTVNALAIPDWTSLTGTGTVNVASGAVVFANGTGNTIENNLDFGAAEGILHIGSIVTLNGVISGSNGITKSGDFSLTTSAAHTYTGLTTINGGGFRFTHPDTFDTTSGFVNRTAGGGELVPSLEYRGTGTAVIDAPADVQSGAFRLSASTAGDNALEYAGVISGPGAVYLESQTTNTGRLILSNDNTYTGGTRIFNAEVELNRDSNLGAGDGLLEINGTAGDGIVLTGDWNTSRPIRVLRPTVINTNGFDMVWNGRIDSDSNLDKLGLGTWRIEPDGIAYGGAAGWSIGDATSTDFTPGGRVEIVGDVRMSWTILDGTLAVDGTLRSLTALSLGGGVAYIAPGDIGGPGIGQSESFTISLARGTHVIFDLGAQSDLLRSITTFSRGAGDPENKIIFDFRAGDGIGLETYTLVEYFSNPSASSTFAVEDFAFTSNIPGFDGFFDLVTFPDNTLGLQFTVTAIPEPAAAGLLGMAGLLLLRRRRAA